MTRHRLATTTLAATIVLAACGAQDDPSPAADTLDVPDDGRTEVDEPQVRLVVATEDGVTVFDPASGTALATFGTDVRPAPVVAGDGRHVLLAQADADVTEVVDAGTWAAGHGDHGHFYIREPQLRDSRIEGGMPVHVVSHGGRTAIFHDDDGAATVFADDGLLIDSLDTTIVDSGAPHHGVVVPYGTGAVVSIPPPPGDDTLPTGVSLVGEDGAEIVRFDDCPGLHGEAALGEILAFACEDGVLLVDGESAEKVAYPSDQGRIGSFTPGPAAAHLVGNYTETSLLAIDVEVATAHEITLDVPYAARALDEHGDLVALTTDGTLQVIDVADGTPAGAVPGVLAPFEIPEDWREPRPIMTVVEHTAYVADPATSTVTVVDLAGGNAVDSFSVDGVPTAIVAVPSPH
jgi:hypothetical protein